MFRLWRIAGARADSAKDDWFKIDLAAVAKQEPITTMNILKIVLPVVLAISIVANLLLLMERTALIQVLKHDVREAVYLGHSIGTAACATPQSQTEGYADAISTKFSLIGNDKNEVRYRFGMYGSSELRIGWKDGNFRVEAKNAE